MSTASHRERRGAAHARRATEPYSGSTAKERNAAGVDASALECRRICGTVHSGLQPLFLELGEDHLARRCLQYAGRDHGHLGADLLLPVLYDDHRAVVEVGDSLPRLFALADHL